MTKPHSTHQFTPGPIGPDIDLAREEIYLQDGTRLTEAKAQELAEWALTQRRSRRGRPSITGGSEHTPNLTLRVRPATRTALEQIAAAQGRRLADIGREALDEYVRRYTGEAS